MNKKDKIPTFVTTARCDMRIIAQILLFWEDKGINISTRSQLIEKTLEAFADMITAQDSASEIHDTEYALRILQERGVMKKAFRNTRTLIQALSLEDVEKDRDRKTVLSEGDEEEAIRIMEDMK